MTRVETNETLEAFDAAIGAKVKMSVLSTNKEHKALKAWRFETESRQGLGKELVVRDQCPPDPPAAAALARASA